VHDVGAWATFYKKSLFFSRSFLPSSVDIDTVAVMAAVPTIKLASGSLMPQVCSR
jgi:hypothetical protein